MNELRDYVEQFSSLRTAKVRGYTAPHKAVLLLAVIDMVEEGVINSPRIRLSDQLDEKFRSLWRHYIGNSPIFIPDITKPFFHMQREPFWYLVDNDEAQLSMVAESSRLFSSLAPKPLPRGGYSIQVMRRAFAYAQIDSALFDILHNTDARAMLRVILINTYLTNQPTKTMPNISQIILALPLLALMAA